MIKIGCDSLKQIRIGEFGYMVGLGDELVVDGDFPNGDNWVEGTGWTIGGGTANFDAVGGQTISQAIAGLASGSTFRVTFTVLNYVAGNVYPQFGGGGADAGTFRTANETYIEDITLSGNRTTFSIGCTGGGDVSVDNVSVREVL